MRARLLAFAALLFFLLALSPVMKRKTPHKAAVPRRQNDARTQTSHLFASETASGDNPVPDDSVLPLGGGTRQAAGLFFQIRVYFVSSTSKNSNVLSSVDYYLFFILEHIYEEWPLHRLRHPTLGFDIYLYSCKSCAQRVARCIQ